MASIFALLWWTLWTLVIVPAHTRGIVPMAAKPACCMCKTAPGQQSHRPIHTRDPCNCAICHLTAVLTTPPPATVIPGAARQILFHKPRLLQSLPSACAPRTILCRGPPAC